jgi:glycosyltransferase involved in cell wall biosynthesis
LGRSLDLPGPRKNIDLLYRALAHEAKEFPKGIPPRLDLVCSSDSAARRAEAAIIQYRLQNTQLLREIDDIALQNAYATSGVFAWPSLREGFGLPPLEAMRCDCPVAASKAPVMPEVLGQAPKYFDPNSPSELAQSLAALLTETGPERQARLLLGRERAAQYTCRQMADQTVAIWKAVAGKRA